MITNATYGGSLNNLVFIEPDNEFVLPEDKRVIEWINEGNIINPYQISISDVIKNKEREIYLYAESQINFAYSNPIQSISIPPDVQRKKMLIRRNQKTDKILGNIALTQIEEDEAKADQKLSEYELKIWNDADKAISNLNKLNTIAEVESFNISEENWNIWNPPV